MDRSRHLRITMATGGLQGEQRFGNYKIAKYRKDVVEWVHAKNKSGFGISPYFGLPVRIRTPTGERRKPVFSI